MKYLHLDPDFTPFGPSIQFTKFKFPDGQWHVRIEEHDYGPLTVTARIKSNDDFMLLMITLGALENTAFHVHEVLIPYFPGARQDRVTVFGEPLSVRLYARSFSSYHVGVFDPHSDVLAAALNSASIFTNHNFIKQINPAPATFLVSPDGGALKKIHPLAQALGGLDVVECSKRRNTFDGSLTGFNVYHEDFEGRPVLIVDDICDGGKTFTSIGKIIRERNCGELSLAVSHGIFSKGLSELGEVFDNIYTTDSYCNEKANLFTDKLKVIPLETILKS